MNNAKIQRELGTYEFDSVADNNVYKHTRTH